MEAVEMRIIGIALLAGIFVAGGVLAAMFYDPALPGHGVTITPIGDEYVAEWYFHDGDGQRWVISDVCEWSAKCPIWAVRATRFPAVGSKLIDAGHIVLDWASESKVVMTYDLDIPEYSCANLPGPFPPECRDDGGNPDRTKVVDKGFAHAGVIQLDLLAN